MFFWFLGTAVMSVGFVFRDPRFDHRLLLVGAVLPLADGLLGGAGVLHSVTASVAVLAAVMLATLGRRPVRRMLLGLPIGMFLHLVFDGAWSDTETFWWPLTGLRLPDAGWPVAERGLVSVGLEAIGVGICVWLWRRNGLSEAERRRRFVRYGTLTPC